jgi:hypothetical protein
MTWEFEPCQGSSARCDVSFLTVPNLYIPDCCMYAQERRPSESRAVPDNLTNASLMSSHDGIKMDVAFSATKSFNKSLAKEHETICCTFGIQPCSSAQSGSSQTQRISCAERRDNYPSMYHPGGPRRTVGRSTYCLGGMRSCYFDFEHPSLW